MPYFKWEQKLLLFARVCPFDHLPPRWIFLEFVFDAPPLEAMRKRTETKWQTPIGIDTLETIAFTQMKMNDRCIYKHTDTHAHRALWALKFWSVQLLFISSFPLIQLLPRSLNYAYIQADRHICIYVYIDISWTTSGIKFLGLGLAKNSFEVSCVWSCWQSFGISYV